MIYFGILKDFDSVEEIAAKHFERTSSNHWQTRNLIDGVHKGFYLFPNISIDLPNPKGYKAVLRAYETDILRMLEGDEFEQKIERMKQIYEGCVIHADIKSAMIRLRAELPFKHRNHGEEPAHPARAPWMMWEAKKSSFAQMMDDLWYSETCDETWAAYDIGVYKDPSSVDRRGDIECLVRGQIPSDDELTRSRVVFDPADFNAQKERIYRRGSSGPPTYIKGSNGTYFAPGMEPRDAAIREACGVLPPSDDRRDGM